MKKYFEKNKFLHPTIFIVCGFSFILFGYDQGVFSGILIMEDFLKTFNYPNDSQTGIMVSIYNLGCFFGCIVNFFTAEYLGRRRSIWAAMFVIIIGAILQTTAFTMPHMLVGRFVTGMGTGIETSTVPMYQAEICEAKNRGNLMSTEVLFINLGIILAYFFDYGMSFVPGPIAWRLPIAFQMVFCFVVIALVFVLPESPRSLLKQGKEEEALSVMCRLKDSAIDDPSVLQEKDEILRMLTIEKDYDKWISLIKKDKVQSRRRVLLAIGILTMNQLGGINLVVYYVTTIMKNGVGLSDNLSYILGGCIQIVMLLGGIIPAVFLDKMGRRRPMMVGSIITGTSMLCIAVTLSLGTKSASTASIAFFFLYNFSFGVSFNSIPWLYVPEILPLRVRAKGSSLAVSACWIFNFFIVMITPVLLERITWKSYLIFMITSYCFAPIIYFFYPETSKLSLEQIDKLFLKLESGDVSSDVAVKDPITTLQQC